MSAFLFFYSIIFLLSSLSIFFVFQCFLSALSFQSFWASKPKVAFFGSIRILSFFTAFSKVRSHAPSIRSHRGTKVVWPDIQPMRVPEEPVCIDLFRQNPVFTSLHLKYPVHVVPPLSKYGDQAVFCIWTQFILTQDFDCTRIRIRTKAHVILWPKTAKLYFFPTLQAISFLGPVWIHYTWVKRGTVCPHELIYLKVHKHEIILNFFLI